MLPQFFVSLKFFILSLLAVNQAHNPYSCPSILKTLDDYESCYLKANYDYIFCQTEQMDCLNSCLHVAGEFNRFGLINQPTLTSFIKISAHLMAASCNSLCKKPYNYDWPCLDQQRDKEGAWIDMRLFKTDKRTEEQKKEENALFFTTSDEEVILNQADLEYLLANPTIYLQTIPKKVSEEEFDYCLRYRQYPHKSPCTQEKQDELQRRIDARNNYLHRKMYTDPIEAMIKYWDSHTDFAIQYIRPECPILTKKSKSQCIRAFIDSITHQAYIAKREIVMQELQRRALQLKAVAIRQKQEKKSKKKIKAHSRKAVYFMGETPKRIFSKQALGQKNKAPYKLAHR
jgi:hypothetical protein